MAKTVIVFIPGITGSDLQTPPFVGGSGLDGFKVWLTLKFLLGMNPDSIDQYIMDPNSPLDAPSMVGMAYDETLKYFESKGWSIRLKKALWLNVNDWNKDKIFYEFPHDWRKDVRENANKLNVFIETQILSSYPDAEINLVAHSAGGLISRAYLSNKYRVSLHPHPEIKKQILIGTPNHGAPKVYRLLRTGEGFAFEWWPASNLPPNLMVLSHEWKGVYQLLPSIQYEQYFEDYGPVLEILDLGETIRGTYFPAENSTFGTKGAPKTVENARRYCSLDNDALVEDALKLHHDLSRNTFLEDKTYVICADDQETPTGINIPIISRPEKIIPTFKNIGDGTVPAKSTYDLAGLSDDGGIHPDGTLVFNFKSKMNHLGLGSNKEVLDKVIEIINM